MAAIDWQRFAGADVAFVPEEVVRAHLSLEQGVADLRVSLGTSGATNVPRVRVEG